MKNIRIIVGILALIMTIGSTASIQDERPYKTYYKTGYVGEVKRVRVIYVPSRTPALNLTDSCDFSEGEQNGISLSTQGGGVYSINLRIPGTYVVTFKDTQGRKVKLVITVLEYLERSSNTRSTEEEIEIIE